MAKELNWIQIYNWKRPNLQWKQGLPELYWTFDDSTKEIKYKYNNVIYTLGVAANIVSDHDKLNNLSYAASGHTGFQIEYAILNTLGLLPNAHGFLHNDGTGVLSYLDPTSVLSGNVDGGGSNETYLILQDLECGNAATLYGLNQKLDGGNA